MKYVTLIVAIMSFTYTMYGQPQGRIHAGLSSSVNQNTSITPKGKYHTGYFFGLEGAMTQSSVSPMVSFQYHKRNILANSHMFLPEKDVKMDFLKLRGGFNLVFYRTKHFKLRGKGLFSGNVILKLDDAFIKEQGNGPLNEVNPSWVAGIGADIYGISIDVEYEKCIKDSYVEMENSCFRAVHLSLGICF